MTVLVTGGSGFLGSHIVEQLSQAGRNVRALVRRTSKLSFLRSLDNVELVFGAVDDRDSVFRAANGVTGIIHAAGLVKARGPDEFSRVNTGGTQSLLEAAVENSATVRRFVLVSSLSAAGPSDDFGRPIPEDQAPAPVTHYGKSKLAAERAALRVKDRLPVVILRPPAIYGPRDREILVFFQALNKRVLPLTNPVKNKLSMIYGSDCAAACIRALDAEVSSGSVLHLDDGDVYTFEDMIRLSESALGKRALVRLALPKRVVRSAALLSEAYGKATGQAVMLTRDKCNELFAQWVCDGTGAQRMLGWEPKVRFPEGVRKTVDWYRQNGWL